MSTLSGICIEHAIRGDVFAAPYDRPLALELAFTRRFRQFPPDRTAAREVACLRILFPSILQSIRRGDRFAGRIRYPLVGFSPEAMGYGYYCLAREIRRVRDSADLDERMRGEVDDMLAFWEGRTTQAKARAAFPSDLAALLASDEWLEEALPAFPLYRLAGTVLDFAKLLELGLGGLRQQILIRAQGAADPAARDYLEASADAIDLVAACCRHYADHARDAAAREEDAPEAERLNAIADTLEAIVTRPPTTFAQAIQLTWLYALVSGTWNYGRADTYLAAFLERDLATGALTEQEALELLRAWWRLIADYDNQFNNRVIVGGRGRGTPEQERACDRFARLAIAATRAERRNQPQLSLRLHEGMSPDVRREALDAIAEGCTFPILYNDDVNVPAVAEAFSVAPEEAEQYTPYGCGEYVLAHRSVATPNIIINLARCLELAMEDVDPAGGFDDVWRAYTARAEHCVRLGARAQRIIYDAAAADAPFLLLSALYDDCIERGRPLLAGGVRYLGGTLETYGNTNVADALVAIQEVVDRQKRFTLGQVRDALRADFAGHEHAREALLGAPKYGNDDDVADAMAVRVHEHICRFTRRQAAEVGLHHFLVVVINNWANVALGIHTGATADGRRAGTPLANGNAPHPGNDRAGLTALFNSLVKPSPALHAGAVQNMKFSPQLFARHRAQAEALLDGYFRIGGAQAMITVVSAADLQAALAEPQKWGHLMVRVGGFSARFIDLPRAVQEEIIARALYGAET